MDVVRHEAVGVDQQPVLVAHIAEQLNAAAAEGDIGEDRCARHRADRDREDAAGDFVNLGREADEFSCRTRHIFGLSRARERTGGGRAQGPPLRLPRHVAVERGGGESAAVRDAVAAWAEAGGRKARPYGYQGTSLWSEVGERAPRSGTRWRYGQRRAGARPAPTATRARRGGARWGRERGGPGRGGGM